MFYSKIKMGLARLNAEALLALALHVITKLTANLNFPTPNPALVDLTTAADELRAAINAAMGGSKESYLLKATAVRKMQGLLRILADYVNGVAAGNPDLIANAGFDYTRPAEPVGQLPPPTSLSAMVSNKSGVIKLDWDVVHGSNLYTVDINETDSNEESAWSPVYSTTKSKCEISALDPGKFYRFRVRANGAAGASGASEIARSVAA